MKRVPSPPITAAALSGFVVGVILTLLTAGVVTSGSHPQAVPTLPPATPVADPALRVNIYKIVARQLGPSPTSKGPRVLSVDPEQAAPDLPTSPLPPNLRRERSVWIRFRLNDHPLGKAWRLRAARADVFAVMKALFTSQLPIYSVVMEGYFPVPSNKGVKEEPVLVAYMDHITASNIPWKRWGRESEARLWRLLPYLYIDPRFA